MAAAMKFTEEQFWSLYLPFALGFLLAWAFGGLTQGIIQ